MKIKQTILLCAGIMLGLLSCQNQSAQKAAPKQATDQRHPAALEKDPRSIGGEKSSFQEAIDAAEQNIANSDNPIFGYWVGSFGNNMINITLSSIVGKEISGHSVCAGNYRPIHGTIETNPDGSASIVMSEPGDDQYDGTFVFEINAANDQLTGNWTPFKAKGNKAKTFSLAKRKFAYDPTAGKYKQTSVKLLKESDVENLTEANLRLMRSEIYARHGYCFQEKDMRRYFEKQDWYMPVGIDIRDRLSDIESKNINLIYDYEEYYNMNYDGYGR